MKKTVEIGFEEQPVLLPLNSLVPVRIVAPAMKKAKKFLQIAVSVEEVGIVEPLIVHRTAGRKNEFLLLDGHMRLEVLKDLGVSEAPCLVAKDDEAFTYNKRINRLTGIQEHYMILRAIENGVSESKIAKALGVNIGLIRDKRKLLDGICPEAIDLLKDRRFPVSAAAFMRRMNPVRQIEMAELMVAMNNFSSSYARALLAATPASQLVEPTMKKPLGGISEAERQTMEREIETIHRDVKAIEEEYGTNMLRLVVANGYLGRLLENEQVAGYLRRHHGELFRELQTLQEGISADMGILSKVE